MAVRTAAASGEGCPRSPLYLTPLPTEPASSSCHGVRWSAGRPGASRCMSSGCRRGGGWRGCGRSCCTRAAAWARARTGPRCATSSSRATGSTPSSARCGPSTTTPSARAPPRPRAVNAAPLRTLHACGRGRQTYIHSHLSRSWHDRPPWQLECHVCTQGGMLCVLCTLHPSSQVHRGCGHAVIGRHG